jgi:myo-inositol 2-dehydrogenase / D-chiro-inositol 1-dehydrogenase
MRIGLVGAGRIGRVHVGTLRRHPEVDKVLVTDVDEARAEAFAAETGSVPASLQDILGGGAVDAVVIAASTSSHAELVQRSADAGLPVFCEKPLALDLAGTRAVLDRVRAFETKLQLGFQRRFDPGYVAARTAVRQGALGDVHTVRSFTYDAMPPPAEYVPLSGGLLRDCMVHDFDSIRWVTGQEITEIMALGSNVGADYFREAGDVDTSVALLQLSADVLATVTAGRYNGAGYDVRLEVAGTRDTVSAGLDRRTPVRSTEPGADAPADEPWRGFQDRFAAAYRDEVNAFVDYVLDRRPNPCPGEEALEALLVAEAGEVSRRERRPVTVAEVR